MAMSLPVLIETPSFPTKSVTAGPQPVAAPSTDRPLALGWMPRGRAGDRGALHAAVLGERAAPRSSVAHQHKTAEGAEDQSKRGRDEHPDPFRLLAGERVDARRAGNIDDADRRALDETIPGGTVDAGFVGMA
jgi:hypothetical protein